METCSLCCDNSKSPYLNVLTIQIDTVFISISDMASIFKGLEQVWNSKEQKNICSDCLHDLQTSYLFYKKCLKAKESLSEFVQKIPEPSDTLPPKPSAKPFQCCNKRFSTNSILDKHKQITHGIACRFLCHSCPKLFLSKRSLQVHRISHKREKGSIDLQCNLCRKQFTHLGMFNKHKQRHADMVCYYCNRGFIDREMTKHIADSHADAEKRFSCVSCRKAFGKRKILLLHFRTVHAKIMPLFCGHCDEPFGDRDKLKIHLTDCDKSKTNEKDEYWNIERLNLDDDLTTEWLNCEMLNNDYLNVDNGESTMVEEFLDDAFEMLAGQSEELKCHHCSTVFMSARDLIMHDITNHDSVKRDLPDKKTFFKQDPCYKCPKCEEKFTKQNNLNVHMAHIHGEFVLWCNECGAAFNELNKLRDHRKKHHMENISSLPAVTRDGKNLCTLCDKYFTTNGLKYHLKSHSNVVPAFACSFCDKKFIANTNLNAHVRIRHSETKQYPCSHCERQFATMDHLKKHTASVHLLIRNFKCNFCDKSFRQKSHLNQHSWQHSGVKQYQCSLCIKAYTSKSSLRNHMLKVHSLSD